MLRHLLNRQPSLDLYTDHLLSSFGQTTVTSLARLTDGVVGHDAVTDLLNQLESNNRTLWQHVKPLIRQIQEPDGVLLTDDSIVHKPHSDENGLLTTHYDHTSGEYVCRLYLKAMQAAFIELTVLKNQLSQNPEMVLA